MVHRDQNLNQLVCLQYGETQPAKGWHINYIDAPSDTAVLVGGDKYFGKYPVCERDKRSDADAPLKGR